MTQPRGAALSRRRRHRRERSLVGRARGPAQTEIPDRSFAAVPVSLPVVTVEVHDRATPSQIANRARSLLPKLLIPHRTAGWYKFISSVSKRQSSSRLPSAEKRQSLRERLL